MNKVTFCQHDGCTFPAQLGSHWCAKHRRILTMNTTIGPLYEDEGLLAFQLANAGSNVLQADAQRCFKPRGLMLWDVGTLQIEAALIGTNFELLSSIGKVPARWFTVAASFEQVIKSFAEGKEPGQGWGTWSQVYPGIRIQLRFDGPADKVQAIMWGHVVR